MSQWKETHRGLVFPWNCDNYGHMNVRFYWDHFDDSAFQTWTAIGCPPELFHTSGLHFVTGRNTVSYASEMRAGTLFVVTAGLTRVGNKSVTFTHRMHNTETGELCASMTGTEVMFDPKTRRAEEIPADIRERLNELLIETEDDPHPATTGTRLTIDTSGPWHEVHRGLVFPWRCDHFGHMNARWYGHHFDDGGFHLFSMAGVDVADLQAQNIALVTLQTDLTYVREMTAGTLFVIRSGFSHVGTKSAKHIHCLFNVANLELCATMEAVDVAFDMEVRKAVPLPDNIRAGLLDNLVAPNEE